MVLLLSTIVSTGHSFPSLQTKQHVLNITNGFPKLTWSDKDNQSSDGSWKSNLNPIGYPNLSCMSCNLFCMLIKTNFCLFIFLDLDGLILSFMNCNIIYTSLCLFTEMIHSIMSCNIFFELINTNILHVLLSEFGWLIFIFMVHERII